MTEAIVPSDVFFSGARQNHQDPWALATNPEPHRPYRKRDGQPAEIVSFRMPQHMHEEMKQIIQKEIIPGINTFSDFMVDCTAFYLSRFHELGIAGFSGFKTDFDNERRRQRSQDNKNFLDSNDETIDTLVSDRDLYELRETLHGLIDHRDNLQNEPLPFREKLNKQIARIEALLKEAE